MTFPPEFLIALLTALGLGGIVGAFFNSRFEHQKEVKEQQHELKRRRYGAILILLLTKLDPQTGLSHLEEIRPDLKTLEDINQEIKTEFLNSLLYASDDVVKALMSFTNDPHYETYVIAAIAMRRDLWGRWTAIDEGTIRGFVVRHWNKSQNST